MYAVKEYFKKDGKEWKANQYIGASFYQWASEAIKAFANIGCHGYMYEYAKVYQIDFDEFGNIFEVEVSQDDLEILMDHEDV